MELLQVADHPAPKKKVFLQTSKKFGCGAKVAMREVVFFPSSKISEDTERKRKSASQTVRQQASSNQGEFCRRIVVTFPEETEHNHIVGSVR